MGRFLFCMYIPLLCFLRSTLQKRQLSAGMLMNGRGLDFTLLEQVNIWG